MHIYYKHKAKIQHAIWRIPNSLRDSNVSPKLKNQKNKESGHAPWLVAL
jgi:hypothetical protein